MHLLLGFSEISNNPKRSKGIIILVQSAEYGRSRGPDAGRRRHMSATSTAMGWTKTALEIC